MAITDSNHQAAINHPIKARANRKKFSSTFVKKGLIAAGCLPSVKLIEIYDQLVTDIKLTGVKIKKMIR